jgi:hypothetical protein
VAISGNLTVVGQTAGGYLSVTPTPTSAPATSNLNFPAGDTRANGLTARLNGSGALSIVYNGPAGATTHVILDVTGYYLDDPDGLRFYPIVPTRYLDTRSPAWATPIAGALRHATSGSMRVAGQGALPTTVEAITGNLTVIGPTHPGYVSMTPTPTTSPSTSTVNVPEGDVRANGVTSPAGESVAVSFVYRSRSGETTHLVLDVTGYFD